MVTISRKSKVKGQKLKVITSFIRKYYFLLIFVGCIGFVGVIATYKLFIVKPTYIYAKVKVGQGLWWASTQRPSLWFVKAIQQAKEKKDVIGKPVAKIINVSYYPYYGSSQYDIYITVQLKISKVGNNGTYNYNRETIGVSSPIDLEFPNVQFSGTIIEMSTKPLKEELVDASVFLTKKYAYPWEYDEIQIGDSFVNGKQTIFQVLDKAKGETNEVYTSETGKLISTESETYRYIIIKAKMKLKKVDTQLAYGEESIISPGRALGIITSNLTLNDYVVAKVE